MSLALSRPSRILVLCGNDAPPVTAANVYADKLAHHDIRFLEEQVLSPGRILKFSRRRLRAKGLPSLLGTYLYYGLQLLSPVRVPEKTYTPELVSRDFSTDPDVKAFVRDFNPEVILIGFCGLLSEEFLQRSPCAVYNIHPGINPRYRGFGNIWALRENNLDCLGFTIHEVDAGTDTGRRVAVVPLSVADDLADVPFAELDAHVAGLAAAHLSQLLQGQAEAAVPEAFTDLPSVLYGAPTLSVCREAQRNFNRAVNRTALPQRGAA
jgi:Methionyl-tRNA formyltransferase